MINYNIVFSLIYDDKLCLLTHGSKYVTLIML